MASNSSAGRTTRVAAANKLGVFDDNRKLPLHRWYPFVEGFSSDLVGQALDARSAKAVFDPFGGSGTTALTAAVRGVPSFFTEVNPFLGWVADVKVNQVADFLNAELDPALVAKVKTSKSATKAQLAEHPLWLINQKRDFIPEANLKALIGTLAQIDEMEDPLRQIAKLAVLTSILDSSNMIRRTDLRRRTGGDRQPGDIVEGMKCRLRAFSEDLSGLQGVRLARTQRVGSDAKGGWSVPTKLELVVTSPPYLNGTNYCRNTKMELLAGGFMADEKSLGGLRDTSIMAGINNVSNRRDPKPPEYDEVLETIQAVEGSNYDQRIPKMVRGYFADMTDVIESVRKASGKGARFLLDIGDSRFGGIHIDTPRLLAVIAERQSWRLDETVQLRARRSYDGSSLRQDLLVFSAI